MTDTDTAIEKGHSLMDTDSRTEKLYRSLLGLFSICAFGALGIISVSHILWRPPSIPTNPSFFGALSSGLAGLGFVFGSCHMYAHSKSKQDLKARVYGLPLMLLLVGILELCLAGYIAYSNLKVLGY